MNINAILLCDLQSFLSLSLENMLTSAGFLFSYVHVARRKQITVQFEMHLVKAWP